MDTNRTREPNEVLAALAEAKDLLDQMLKQLDKIENARRSAILEVIEKSIDEAIDFGVNVVGPFLEDVDISEGIEP